MRDVQPPGNLSRWLTCARGGLRFLLLNVCGVLGCLTKGVALLCGPWESHGLVDSASVSNISAMQSSPLQPYAFESGVKSREKEKGPCKRLRRTLDPRTTWGLEAPAQSQIHLRLRFPLDLPSGLLLTGSLTENTVDWHRFCMSCV